MQRSAYSINGVPIRLPDERWIHITENHDEMAGYLYEVLETVSNPKWVLQGTRDENWAVTLISPRKAMVVIYKETINQNDGFIITAFLTSKVDKLRKRRILWQP